MGLVQVVALIKKKYEYLSCARYIPDGVAPADGQVPSASLLHRLLLGPAIQLPLPPARPNGASASSSRQPVSPCWYKPCPRCSGAIIGHHGEQAPAITRARE